MLQQCDDFSHKHKNASIFVGQTIPEAVGVVGVTTRSWRRNSHDGRIIWCWAGRCSRTSCATAAEKYYRVIHPVHGLCGAGCDCCEGICGPQYPCQYEAICCAHDYACFAEGGGGFDTAKCVGSSTVCFGSVVATPRLRKQIHSGAFAMLWLEAFGFISANIWNLQCEIVLKIFETVSNSVIN